MDGYESLSDTKWDYKYCRVHSHVAEKDALCGVEAASRGAPQAGRAKRAHDETRQIFLPDHIDMMIVIPLKYLVAGRGVRSPPKAVMAGS
jgi:hypothetical protein